MVAHALGVRVESVDVLASEAGERNGRVVTPIPEDFDPYGAGAEEVLEKHLVLALAGPTAEEIVAGDHDHEGAIGDHQDALVFALDLALHPHVRTLTAVPPRTRFDQVWPRAVSLLERSHVRALEVLRENWGAVEAVVEALLERRTLDGPTFAGVVVAREKVFDREDL